MAIYSKKGAKLQFYFIFFAMLIISLFFLIPQFKDNITGKSWIGISVRPKERDRLLVKDSVLQRNADSNARLVSKSDLEIEVKPDSGWGWYIFIQNFFAFVLFFIGLWYVLKFMKILKSEDRFENHTSMLILRLGQLMIFGGMISFLNKLFLNFYLLGKLGFEDYEATDAYLEYIAIGFFLVYISKLFKKGYNLQQESELTV